MGNMNELDCSDGELSNLKIRFRGDVGELERGRQAPRCGLGLGRILGEHFCSELADPEGDFVEVAVVGS